LREHTHPPFIPLDAADLPHFALGRLRRFNRISSLTAKSATPSWQRLARHAVHVAYRDCLALGLREQAEAVLHHAHQATAPVERRSVEPRRPDDEVAVQCDYVMAVVETTVVGRQILARHGVSRGSVEAWYPRAMLVEALREMERAGLGGRVRACGMLAAIKLRPRIEQQGIADLGSFLERQGEYYLSLHRGEQATTVTSTVERGPRGGRATVTCRDPYPCEFWVGWFEGLGANFGRVVRVGHRAGTCKSTGKPECIYQVSW
jgi:hypothetical protein